MMSIKTITIIPQILQHSVKNNYEFKLTLESIEFLENDFKYYKSNLLSYISISLSFFLYLLVYLFVLVLIFFIMLFYFGRKL